MQKVNKKTRVRRSSGEGIVLDRTDMILWAKRIIVAKNKDGTTKKVYEDAKRFMEKVSARRAEMKMIDGEVTVMGDPLVGDEEFLELIRKVRNIWRGTGVSPQVRGDTVVQPEATTQGQC